MVFYKEKALHYKIPSISFIKEKYLFFWEERSFAWRMMITD
jgi:hypothetical protein